jgi:hypothetical protein
MLHFVTGMQLKQGVPETHTKIHATQHGCLSSLLGNAMGTAKAGQKSLVSARQADSLSLHSPSGPYSL